MKLSLRDLFWLTLLVAVGCAWWIDHQDSQRYRRAVRRLQTLGMDLKANHILDD
jgi:hypothetical protein